MRLEEIAQLFCKDIYQDKESSLWVIDVNDIGQDELGLGKSLKNKNAHRRIPIHQTLIELGLLEYRAQVAKAKHIRLFPELKRTARTPNSASSQGNSSAPWSTRFWAILRKNPSTHCGIPLRIFISSKVCRQTFSVNCTDMTPLSLPPNSTAHGSQWNYSTRKSLRSWIMVWICRIL